MARYNQQQIGGRDRAFPEALLLGAEAIVAKAQFEHEHSKSYSPIPLGSVIQCRTFSASGDLNPLTKRKQETKLKVTEFHAEAAEDTWDPRSMLSILDGLQSIRYLFVLLQIGDEQDVHAFFDTLERKARSMPHKLTQYKLYYETASWRLAQTMRRGVAFKAAADEIIGDHILWQETMAKVVNENPDKPGKKRPWEPEKPHKGGKGGKGGGKGRQQDSTAGYGKQRYWGHHLGGSSGSSVDTGRRGPPKMGTGREASCISGMKFRGDPSSALEGGGTRPKESRAEACPRREAAAAGANRGSQAEGRWSSRRRHHPSQLLRWHRRADPGFARPRQARAGAGVGDRREGCRSGHGADPRIITNRGDVTAETGASLAAEIRRIDPRGKLRIMIAAGAPCLDYSRITDGPGRQGDQGQLFGTMCDLLDDFLPRLPGRTVGILVENVFMNAYGDINYFNGRLKAEAVLVDAADFGLVSRPRLWWTRVDWSKCTDYKWTRSGKIYRLHVTSGRDDLAQFDMRGYMFGKEVLAGLQLLPCFTTPAPTESGRSAPKRMKAHIDSATRQRWLDDSRNFAPWHYQKKLEVLPPFLKEQAHHLPADFTKYETCTDRDWHRLLGNSWHKGVASFLFRIVLEHGMFVVEDPGKAPSDPSQSSSSIKEALAGIRALKFPITRVKTPVFRGVPPATDMWDHWRGSECLQPDALQCLPLEPGLEVVLDIVSRLQAPALDSYRARVLSEVERLVQALRQDTDQWYASVPHHVARTLHPHGHSRIEVLAFTKLLRDCGYPDIEALEEDFRTGFPLLGELRHTPGWRPRLDDTYANPISLEAFRQLNQHHVHEKLKHSRLDPHWQHMLEEVLQEVDAGRMEGPFVGPADWPCATRVISRLLTRRRAAKGDGQHAGPSILSPALKFWSVHGSQFFLKGGF